MKKKAVIRVQIKNEKYRRKGMMTAATQPGVEKVAFLDDNRIEIIGERVDFVSLTERLTMKLGYAHIVTLDEVKVEEKKNDDKKEDQEKTPCPCCNCPRHFCPSFHPIHYEVVYDDMSYPPCTIL